MLRTRIIPILLIDNERLVKTTKFTKPKYIGDPINAVRIFNEKEADELTFLDIKASINKQPINFELIKDISSEAFMPIGYGGGINDPNDAIRLFKIGIEKIIINTHAYYSPQMIKFLVDEAGSQSIVGSIDVKKNFFGNYEVYIEGGTKNIKIDPFTYSKRLEDLGVGEIVINSIDKDGTKSGYDLNLINKISEQISIPIVACGGASNVEDFTNAIRNGASAVAAGSMFVLHGKHNAVLITYPNINLSDL